MLEIPSPQVCLLGVFFSFVLLFQPLLPLHTSLSQDEIVGEVSLVFVGTLRCCRGDALQ